MLSVYRASAGSGKTFVLAREFIKFILGRKVGENKYVLEPDQGKCHRHLLAITFTNKATEEMKRRIVHQLAVLAGMEPGWKKESAYLKYFLKEFGCSQEELANASGEALRGVLNDFGSLNISTIDSFFQSVLRSFAREAEVSGNYSVEIDQEEVIRESVDGMMSQINRSRLTSETRWLLEWLEKFMLSRIEEGEKFTVMNRSSPVHSDLIKIISHLSNDDFRENEKLIIDYLKSDDKLSEFIKEIAKWVATEKQLIKQSCDKAFNLLGSSDKNPGISSHLFNALKKWGATGIYLGSNGKLSVGTTIEQAAEPDYPLKPKSSKLNITPELEDALRGTCRLIVNFARQYPLIKLIKDNLYQLGLLRPLADRLDQYRQENQAILLSDTNKIINSIIGNTESPFLYEKIGTRYSHYLIDEFQDTSLSQWQNLEPLLRETDANGDDSLIIGDVKQSIYRFRNSDSSLLGSLSDTFSDSEVHGDSPQENTNWRSWRNVIEFNNAYFRQLALQTGFDDIYGNVTQQVAPKHTAERGFIEFNLFDTGAINDAADKKETVITRHISRHIRRQLASGYLPSDIAILVRTKEQGKAVIATLRELIATDPTWPKVRFVSDKSLLIESVPSVSYIISTLRLLSASDAKIGQKSTSEREKAIFTHSFERSMSDNRLPSDAITSAVEVITKVKSGETSIPMPELPAMTDHDMVSLVENLIRKLPDESRKRDALALATFQDMVVTFVSKGYSDLRSFLEWWDEFGHFTSIPAGKDDGAINVLTIHKSKGLEWKCVYVPFAELFTASGKDVKWFNIKGMIEGIPDEIVPPLVPLKVVSDLKNTPLGTEYASLMREELGDRLNLLYVAFTRATDELVIGLDDDPKSEFGKAQIGIIDALKSEFGDRLKECKPENDQTISQILTIGAPTTAIVDEKDPPTAIEPSGTVVIDSYPVEEPTNMWKGTRLDADHFNHIDVARERGLIIHEILAQIRHTSDIDKALKRFRLSTDGANMPENHFEGLSELIRLRVENPEVKAWFDSKSRILLERVITLPGGDNRRFDRVVWTENGEIHVVDYKTGNQPSRKYRRQMAEYRRLLTGLYSQPVRAFLYYLDTGRIVEM